MSSEIKVDTISENTSANGVVIDSVTLKDGAIGAAGTVTSIAGANILVEANSLFIGDDVSPGIKGGGVLNVVRYNVEVSCTPNLIPNNLIIDLSNSEIGDSLHISAVNLPEGVTPTISDRDFTIATIVAPTVVREEAASDGDDTNNTEAATEGTEDSNEENSEE